MKILKSILLTRRIEHEAKLLEMRKNKNIQSSELAGQ